jgi:hypothetical protein
MEREGDIPKNQLKRVYAEILRGSCAIFDDKYGKVYIKHLKVWDTEALDEQRDLHFEKATSEGLPTKEEKIDLLIKDDLWDKSKDAEIKEKKEFIERMRASKSKMMLKSQIDSIQADIERTQNKVAKITKEKEALLGMTAEIYADKKVNDQYVYLTLFKDAKLEARLLSDEQFEEMSDMELSELVMLYNKSSGRYSERNMKRVALSGFFLNNFYLCKDNPFIFFGKPLVELTYHQSDLFSYGRYFKHVLSEMKHQPPQDVMEDPDKLIEHYDIQQNQEKLNDGKDMSGKATTYIGATKDDMDALGVSKQIEEDPNTLSLHDELKKSGGELSMQDMIKLHGM